MLTHSLKECTERGYMHIYGVVQETGIIAENQSSHLFSASLPLVCYIQQQQFQESQTSIGPEILLMV